MWMIITIALGSWFMGFISGATRERLTNKSYTYGELRTWLIARDSYLYNYYTTYKKNNIPLTSVDDMIVDDHEYLMGRELKK